jgi:hypothetical protein
MDKALTEMDAHDEWGPFAAGFRQFVREVLAAEKPYARGLCPFRRQVFDKR